MTIASAFLAFPSHPAAIGATIDEALREHRLRTKDTDVVAWSESDIAGRFIAESVIDEINKHEALVADITRLNFNVMYEIGYALGRGKRLLLIKNAALRPGQPSTEEVGIVDTLGYQTYENAAQLTNILAGTDSTAPQRVLPPPNREAPVFLV